MFTAAFDPVADALAEIGYEVLRLEAGRDDPQAARAYGFMPLSAIHDDLRSQPTTAERFARVTRGKLWRLLADERFAFGRLRHETTGTNQVACVHPARGARPRFPKPPVLRRSHLAAVCEIDPQPDDLDGAKAALDEFDLSA